MHSIIITWKSNHRSSRQPANNNKAPSWMKTKKLNTVTNPSVFFFSSSPPPHHYLILIYFSLMCILVLKCVSIATICEREAAATHINMLKVCFLSNTQSHLDRNWMYDTNSESCRSESAWSELSGIVQNTERNTKTNRETHRQNDLHSATVI